VRSYPTRGSCQTSGELPDRKEAKYQASSETLLHRQEMGGKAMLDEKKYKANEGVNKQHAGVVS
jgi:hypothetical protein